MAFNEFEEFKVLNNTFIVTKDLVTPGKVANYLEERRLGKDEKGTRYIIYYGAHGNQDGILAHRHQDLDGDTTTKIVSAIKEHDDATQGGQERQESTARKITEKVKKGDTSEVKDRITNLEKDNKKLIFEKDYTFQAKVVGKKREGDPLHKAHGSDLASDLDDLLNMERQCVIILAFCFSDQNELLTFMRALGIVSVTTMREDLNNITGGQWLKLDKNQREIIMEVSSYHRSIDAFGGEHNVPQHLKKAKNIILFGGPGTGKTLILAELLKMRIAHYKRMPGIAFRVIAMVCRPWDEQELLLEDLQNKYFLELREIEFFEYLKELDFAERGDYNATPGDVNALLSKLEKMKVGEGPFYYLVNSFESYCAALNPDGVLNIRTLVFIDELRMQVNGGIQSCEGLEAPSNLEFFIAVSPWGFGESNSSYEVHMPNDPSIMGRQLTGRHRNCREIYELSRHMATTGNNYNFEDKMHLRESNDPIRDIPLPKGKEPLWIVQEESCDTDTLLRWIEKNYIERGMNVTVLQVTESESQGAIESWANEAPKDGGRRRLAGDRNFQGVSAMRGTEDDVIIAFNPDTSPTEMVTRARQRLIIITNVTGDSKETESWAKMLKYAGALDHSNCPLGEECCSKGKKRLIKVLYANNGKIIEATPRHTSSLLERGDELARAALSKGDLEDHRWLVNQFKAIKDVLANHSQDESLTSSSSIPRPENTTLEDKF